MAEANWLGGLLGGALIGLASVLLLALNGRIAGISGILGALVPPHDGSGIGWRIAFLAGLVVGPLLYGLAGFSVPLTMQADGLMLIAAGVLVGAGTRIGAGCTSGHGVCGLAQRSPRSLTATATFMAVAIATVFVTRHLLAGTPS